MKDVNVVLADSPGLGCVRLSECNFVHVSIGPITVNLAPEAFAQMAILIRNAIDQLSEITGSKEANRSLIESFGPKQSRFTH